METAEHTLADLVDLARLQRVCDSFAVAGDIGLYVLDPGGTVLVSAGWQDICKEFHRVHKDTLKGCLESDTRINQRLVDGLDAPEHYAYQCANGLWDVAFPLVIAGAHLGNVFTGQFFYDDDEIDEAAFRQRAQRLGLDEPAYLEALARVPVLSHERVAQTISFIAEVVGMLADLGLAVLRRDQDRAALRESEERYRGLTEDMPVFIAAFLPDGTLTWVNAALAAMEGSTPEAMIGRTFFTLLRPDEVKIVRAELAALSPANPVATHELSRVGPDGQRGWQQWIDRGFYDEEGRPVRYQAVGQDITEGKLAEEALRENQLRYETFINATDDMAFLKDDELRYLIVNTANAAYFDRSVEETIGRTDADLMSTEAAAQCRLSDMDVLERHRMVISQEEVDGRIYETRKFPVALADDLVGVGGYVRDVTEFRLADERLAVAAGQWRQTFDAMTDSVALLDPEGTVLRCNAATTVLTGRDFGEIVGRRCTEVFNVDDVLALGSPRERALESGQTETSTSEQDGRWLRVTFQPLTDEQGRLSGGVHVVSDVTELKHAEQGLLEGLAVQQSVTDGVIAALARTVEIRDPYTAGHQRRVSELGAAMALRMGLGEEHAEGVRVAGMLHDVGKITIPAEILSKPGRLTAMEFQFIKGHSQAGFEILESIHFPWLVAEMALQHHERQDGSGYPRGLQGDQVLPEVRILAVADVVEAMASHRPYRAALGIEAALAEVRSGAGTRYEAAAVEACERVFEEGFVFTES